jgi:hypothetical protein
LKVYVGTKKVDGKYRYGLTIYSDDGVILYSSITNSEISENKFEDALRALDWVTKKIKTLAQNKTLDAQESVVLIISWVA